MKYLLLLILSLRSATGLWAQQVDQNAESLSTFIQALAKGQTALQAREYAQAAAFFEAARDNLGNTQLRRDSAQFWIDSTQRLQITELRRLNDDLKTAKDRSDQSARAAEASRLATLSAQAYREGNYSDALALATIAMQMMENSPLPVVQRVFGDAAYQNYKKVTNSPGAALEFVDAAPNGRAIATATSDGKLQWWDTKGTLLSNFPAHRGPITFLKFSPDSQYLISGSSDGTARLWSGAGQLLAEMAGHTDDVLGAVFNPAGQTILTFGRDGKALLWDLKGQQKVVLAQHMGAIYQAVFFSGNGVITRSADQTVQQWNGLGESATKCSGNAYMVDLDVLTDKGYYVHASADGAIELHRAGHAQIIKMSAPEGVSHVSFSPDGDMILSISNYSAALWSINGKIIATFQHNGRVRTAVLSPDDQTVLTASADGTAVLWNKHGERLAVIQSDAGMVSAQFSPDGQNILTLSDTGESVLWNRNGDKIMTLNGHAGPVRAVRFVKGSPLILTIGEDSTLIICEMPAALYQKAKISPPRLNDTQIKQYGLPWVQNK